jgi:hypothetical protein
MGLRCYPSVDALPEGVDVAVLAIPRAGVLDAVRGLAARKAGGVVIFSAGFAEGARKGWPNSTRSPGSRRGGLVVEGPNCLGLVNYVDRVPLTFVETNAVPPAIAARSASSRNRCDGGGAGHHAARARCRRVLFGIDRQRGGERRGGLCRLDGRSARYPRDRDDRRTVPQAAALPGGGAGARAAGKPIVLLHPGKSSAARESAATHTGAMAGDYKLMRAMVSRAGVIFAETLEELGDIAEIAARCPCRPPATRRCWAIGRVQGADARSGRGTGAAAGRSA